MKGLKKKLNNRGSSFVMVVVTMAFLTVLATSILVAAGFSYRLKVYNMNSRDNFYYVEQALDEIYAGVGSIAVEHLKKAYYDTLKVIVYYDAGQGEYATMPEADANKLMKKAFKQYLQNDTSLSMSGDNVKTTLAGFITDPANNVIDTSNVNVEYTQTGIIIRNVTVKRTAKYDVGGNGGDYIQSITTDIELGEPGFNVKFGMHDNRYSPLYEFSMLADMGVELLGASSQINVSGNIYGAADFYNKDYNGTDEKGIVTTNTFTGKDTDICGYLDSEDRFKACDGLQERSMNSGLYINGAKVILQSDRLIVPGTFGIFNGGQVVVSTNSTSTSDGRVVPCDLWADNVVLGGYTPIAGASRGDIYANAYIYDDLELNADKSLLKLEGGYYGYNWSQSADERSFVEPAKKNYQNTKGENTNDHYNSSSIILNGQETTLDFGKLDKMYIAGRSYVELSKMTTKSEKKLSDDETVETKTYQYDKDIKDYITGESLSVKSNQLAYMPLRTWVKDDKKGKIYATIPANVDEPYQGFFKDLSSVPVIKQEVSGNVYYFFDLKDYKDADGTEHKVDKEQFIQAYAACFEKVDDEYIHTGAKYLKDITNYQRFQVAQITLPTDDLNAETGAVTSERYMYSNGALTAKDLTSFSIKASEKAQEVFNGLLHIYDTNTSYTGDGAFKRVSSELQSEYNMVKYLLSISPTADDKTKVSKKLDENKHYSPIERYVNASAVAALPAATLTGKLLPNGYKVWAGDGDVLIDESNGIGQGLVIAKGDVTFASTMHSFYGLVISGGKIIVDHSMNFFADPAIIREILRQCAALTGDSVAQGIYKCIKDPEEVKIGESGGTGASDPTTTEEPVGSNIYTDATDSLDRDITDVSYVDVISFTNWKKNVE